MLLKEIIKNLPTNIQNINIKGLSLDSTQIKKNFLFFAKKGSKHNGESYIVDAIRKGATAVVCDINCKIKKTKIPIIKVENIKKTIVDACKYFTKLNQKILSLLQVLMEKVQLLIFIIKF